MFSQKIRLQLKYANDIIVNCQKRVPMYGNWEHSICLPEIDISKALTKR